MATVTVDVGNWASKARLQCPRGHTWWEAQGENFYCRSCETVYELLIDCKTGRHVDREQVRITRR